MSRSRSGVVDENAERRRRRRLERNQMMKGSVSSLESQGTWSAMSPAGSGDENAAERRRRRRLERNQMMRGSVSSLESQGTWSAMSPADSGDENAAERRRRRRLERNQRMQETVVDVDSLPREGDDKKVTAEAIETHTSPSNKDPEMDSGVRSPPASLAISSTLQPPKSRESLKKHIRLNKVELSQKYLIAQKVISECILERWKAHPNK